MGRIANYSTHFIYNNILFCLQNILFIQLIMKCQISNMVWHYFRHFRDFQSKIFYLQLANFLRKIHKWCYYVVKLNLNLIIVEDTVSLDDHVINLMSNMVKLTYIKRRQAFNTNKNMSLTTAQFNAWFLTWCKVLYQNSQSFLRSWQKILEATLSTFGSQGEIKYFVPSTRRNGGGLALMVVTLVRSKKLFYVGPG